MNRIISLTVVALIAVSVARPAHAQHEGDIYVGPDAENRLTTGAILPGPTIDTPITVFAGNFGDSGFSGFTANPGFDTLPGTFDPASRNGFNILEALQVWDGESFVSTDHTIRVSFLSAFVVTGDGFVPGFDLAIQSNGGWHRHFSFFVEGPGGAVPTPGIYRLRLELYSTDPSLSNSEPFSIVFNHERPEQEHQDAIDFEVADQTPPCTGDLVAPFGAVDTDDLLAVINQWGCSAPDPCTADIAEPFGIVDVEDILAVINAWGDCPGQ